MSMGRVSEMDSKPLCSVSTAQQRQDGARRADDPCQVIGRYGHESIDILDAPAADLFLLKAQRRRQCVRRADTCLSEFSDLGFADSFAETDIHSMFSQKKMKTILIFM